MVTRKIVGIGACVLAILGTACSSDSDESAVTTIGSTVATTTSSTTTTTTTLPLVVDGATVVVVNASDVAGSATQLTDQLEALGYSVVPPMNRALTIDRLDTTEVLVARDDEAAVEVAKSVIEVLGLTGSPIYETGVPAPTRYGWNRGATVFIMLGLDRAGSSIPYSP